MVTVEQLAALGVSRAAVRHRSTHLERRVWEADHARQNALILAGWTVLRFTWRDYIDRRRHLVAEVRAALTKLGDPRP